MTTTPAPLSSSDLDDLAHAVAVDGPAVHDSALRRLAVAVRAQVGRASRTDVAVEVMLDPYAPEVLRSRAFGLVSAALVAVDREATPRRARDLAA